MIGAYRLTSVSTGKLPRTEPVDVALRFAAGLDGDTDRRGSTHSLDPTLHRQHIGLPSSPTSIVNKDQFATSRYRH